MADGGDGLRDTIVALATPPGPGAVALIRLSGPASDDILRRVAPSMEALPEARRATLLTLVDGGAGEVVDRALVTRFPAPDSYTGEDVVEMSTHGGWWIPSRVLDLCRSLGAREAERGEFTRRAYLHGKMDLVQAEAVGDLVEAGSTAMHRNAVELLDRGLSRRVGELRRALVSVEAALAHHLDFPEEDDAPVPLSQLRGRAAELAGRMERLLATAPQGALLKEGAVTVLAGPPNAGKSSLYNALVGENRAIVTEVPGTTRDALESVVELGGYPFRLVDTAGLRATEDRVERVGIEVARTALARADLVLYCREVGTEEEVPAWLSEQAGGAPVVRLTTKVDRRVGSGSRDGTEDLAVSAETGEGLGDLRRHLVDLVYGGLVEAPDRPVLTRRRQVEALRGAAGSVRAFGDALDEGVPADVASAHLRAAEQGLEELLGVISVDDVLDVVFASFCIGK